MKTARFTAVVAAAGHPQVHSLWLAPDKDPQLKRAAHECRVMTIHQMLRGTKKDYGTVGLHAGESSQVLVFPKNLRRFSDARIVGIDYSLIVQPEPKDPVPPPKSAPRPRAAPKPASAPPRAPASPTKSTSAPRAPSARTKPQPAEPPQPKPLTREELLDEIRRAVRELKAGKAVAAYERLSELLED